MKLRDREPMNIPELITRNWKIKVIALVIALLIWYFIVGAVQ